MKSRKVRVTNPIDGGQVTVTIDWFVKGDFVDTLDFQNELKTVRGKVIVEGKPLIISAMDLWVEQKFVVELENGRQMWVQSGDATLATVSAVNSKIAHRFQTSETQTRYDARCQCDFWLCNGLAQQGPLNSKPVSGEVVWADSPEEAHDILMNSGNGWEWVEIIDEDKCRIYPNPVVKEPWNLPKDHEVYCPF